jgi:hypothetical protein
VITEITKTTKHVLTFQVKEFSSTEGGMDVDTFGEETNDLKVAVNNIELARSQYAKADWVIECRVQTKIN